MRWTNMCMIVAVCVFSSRTASAVVFQTHSTATQTITSPVFGGAVPITATGLQTFDIDVVAGTADVTSDLKGQDLPDPLNPGAFLTYDLYNTTTTGSVATMPTGYDVGFDILFELRVTSGPLTGLTFETQQPATFSATNVGSIPFPAGVAFSDPTPPDALPVFVKFDPSGTFPPGALVGTSSERIVRIDAAVPEPSSLALSAIALVAIAVARPFRSRALTGR